MTLPGAGGVVTFTYDPFGRRIQKSSASGMVNYVYDGANLVAEADALGNAVAAYAQGAGIDEPLAMSRAGVTSYYQADGLGSITSLASATGVLSATYSYDAFGNLTNSAGDIVNPFRYTGREWDQETTLYYYRARYYDATTGRFLTEDPIDFRGGINFYVYVENNPINLVDPSGTQVGMAQVQALARGRNPCDRECIKRYLNDLQKALGKPGCVVICATLGFSDDAAAVGLSLLSKRIRTWLSGATGKLVMKSAGVCGAAAATVYCTIKCDVFPPPEVPPSRYMVPGLTPFRIMGWTNGH